MRKIREVLRLYFAAALSVRGDCPQPGDVAVDGGRVPAPRQSGGVSWPVPEAIDDAGRERRLFPALPSSHTSGPLPEWSEVRRELRGKKVTLASLRSPRRSIRRGCSTAGSASSTGNGPKSSTW